MTPFGLPSRRGPHVSNHERERAEEIILSCHQTILLFPGASLVWRFSPGHSAWVAGAEVRSLCYSLVPGCEAA